jgi:hypothetical protein
MDGLRWIIAIGTGAVVGIAAALALDLSYRWMRRPAAATPVPGVAPPLRLALDPQSWPVKAAIVAIAIAFYGLVGYLHRPLAPPAIEPPAPAADAPPAADTGPAAFAVGGVTLNFAPPSGSCLYPAPLLEAVRLQQAQLNPDNVIDSAFADCGQLQNSVANQARIRNFGILMTPKADLTQHVDRATTEAMAAAMPDPTGIEATLEQRLSAAQSKLALQSFSALGPIDRDPQGIYFAYLSKAQGADGVYTQACVMAMTAINGRLVSYYLYSDYDKDPRPVIFGLLEKAKAAATDLAQRNRS